jgi:signal transduction histidine kinase
MKEFYYFIRKHLIIIVLILLTASMFVIFPSIMYKYPKGFDTFYRRYDRSEDFIIVPTQQDTVIISFHPKGALQPTSSVCIKYLDYHTNNLKEKELEDLSCINILGGQLSNLYLEESSNTVYTIFAQNNSEYYLHKLWQDNKIAAESDLIFDYKLHKELRDSTITINGKRFYSSKFSKTTSLEKYKDGFRFNISGSEKQELKTLRSDDYNENSYVAFLAGLASAVSQTDFSNADIYTIFAFFRRNSHYQSTVFSDDSWKHKGFMLSAIVGKIDGNNDGNKDFLINIKGRRWIDDLLLCYDVTNKQVIWKRRFSDIQQRELKIIDIDDDGSDEILFSTYAPSNQRPIDWYKYPSGGDTVHSFFRILTSEGNDKIINDSPLIIKSETHYCFFKFLYNEESKSVLLGLFQEYDKKDKFLLNYSLVTGIVDTLNIPYKNIVNISTDNGNIIVLDNDLGILKKKILNPKMKLVNKKSYNVNYILFRIWYSKLKLLGKEYYLNSKSMLCDKNFNFIDIGISAIFSRNYQVIGNTLHFIENNNEKYYRSSVTFSRNKTLSPVLILIIIFELILILMYYYFRQLLFLPFVSGKSSYAVLYRIFGVVYHWRIYGKLSYLKFPKNISRNEEIFFILLESISQRYEIESEKKSIILNVTSYKLLSDNDFFIFNDRVHDIIPILGLVSGNLRRYKKFEKDSDLVQQTTRDVGIIQHQLRELLDFTKPMSFTKIDIAGLLEVMVFSYSNHNRFDDIMFDDFNKEFIIVTDESKINIILRNLLHNAVKYSNEDTKINITIEQTETECVIRIINTGHISDKAVIGKKDKSQGGSGIGIRICNTTIEKLNGKLLIEQKGDFVSATVKLLIK